MSYINCLKQSKITPKKLKEAQDIYNRRFQDYKQNGYTEKDADIAAGEDTANAISLQKSLEKKRKLKMLQAQKSLESNLNTYRDGKGRNDIYSAAVAVFERDQFSKFPSIVGREHVIRGSAHAVMADFLQTFEPKFAGTVRPKANLENVVRESFGVNTGDASAKEMASAVQQGFELLRMRANRAGANIGKKEIYGFPQVHDKVKISKMGKQAWVDYVMPKLDWDKMRDPNTELPIPQLKRQAVIESVYDTITTEGYSKLKPGEMQRLGALDKRLANHRFLEFKSADDWLEYQSSFGQGTPFDVAINHVQKMSRDIAMMEILGPNPNAGKETLKALVMQKAAKQSPKAVEKAKKLSRKLDDLYANYANTNTAGGESAIALTFAGTRNIMTSAFLGGASLLAIPGDTFTKALTKGFNKLPGALDISQYAKILASKENQNIAIRAGLIAESATSLAYGQQRFMGEVLGPQWTRRVADFVMRASLMTAHTQSARWAFGMEFVGALYDYKGKKFDDLPFKAVMDRYGITPEDWEIYKATQPFNVRGAKFIRPDDVRVRKDLDPAQAQKIADKFMEMIFGEMEYAVPTASLRGRSFLLSQTRPATISGELTRSFAMFKTFPVTVVFTHIARAISQEGFKNKLAYAAAFGTGMTMMGALGLQAREIAQGKDPRNMNPFTEDGRKFWLEAALVGGGLSIWGDFIFSDVNRYGGGLTDTAAGPVVSFLDDTRNLSVGNVMELVQGEDTGFASELNRYISQYAPGNTIWYLRLVLQREIFDQIQKQVDPKAARKFNQMERQLQREKGQDYWWAPGESVLQGDRIDSPDFGRAIEE